jgi:hypothetical protein
MDFEIPSIRLFNYAPALLATKLEMMRLLGSEARAKDTKPTFIGHFASNFPEGR